MRLLMLLIVIKLSKVTICLKEASIGEVCQENEECGHIKFSECSNERCTCNTDIFSECLEDIQCSSTLGFGSEYHKGVCKYKVVDNYNNSINKCVLHLLLGNECNIHRDCHQKDDEERFECFLGIYKYKVSYVKHHGYCVQSSGWTWTSFTVQDVLPYISTYAFFYMIR